MRRTRTTTAAAGTVLALTLTSTLAACGTGSSDGSGGSSATGEDGGLTPVTLQLQWVAQAQFAGYYAALDQGYYEDEGLDVTIQEAGTDTVPIDVLAAGDADYAISWVPKVLGSIEQGTEVTNVAQVFERSGTLQIAFADSGISEPADLAGTKVGSWGYGNEWELFAGMQEAGIDTSSDIDLVQQAFDMNGFLAGDIDAAQAMTYNEYAQVLETVNPDTGELYQPDDLSVIDWNDHGTAMLQDAIWADTNRLADDEDYADTTVKFLKASLKGWVYARDDPQAAADAVTAAGSTLGASHQLWQTNEVNKLVWPSTAGVGVMDEDLWQQTVDIAMSTQNETGATIITSEPPDTAYSTEYVTQAIAELEDEGVDVTGADFEPIEVTLQEGGS